MFYFAIALVAAFDLAPSKMQFYYDQPWKAFHGAGFPVPFLPRILNSPTLLI
jgi:hypothetical protein